MFMYILYNIYAIGLKCFFNDIWFKPIVAIRNENVTFTCAYNDFRYTPPMKQV